MLYDHDVRQSDRKARSLQSRVWDWCKACFGSEKSRNKDLRQTRFLEEALELVQAGGLTEADAQEVVRYVFNRPKGEVAQEVGGTVLTLCSLCESFGVDMMDCAETELTRVEGKIEAIRRKEARKPQPV